MKKILALLLSLILASLCLVIPVSSSNKGYIALSAESAVLLDLDSRAVLYEKDSDKRMGMASTTKIMTALVVAEHCELEQEVRIPDEAIGVEGSSIYLQQGETLTLLELLYALLLQSANDAAVAIAIETAGSVASFADMMNRKAEELGLRNTHFTNPHGLDEEEHYTTAHDLALISACALENETIRSIVSTYKKSLPISSSCTPRVLVNHNKLLKLYRGTIGVKTGFTKATGRCLVSAAERDGLTLIAVTLNAPDDWRDHRALLDFGFENYESHLLASVGSFTYALSVSGGDEDLVTLTNTEELRMTLPKQHKDLKCRVETYHRFELAPIMRGGNAGRVYYFYGEDMCVSSPLVYAENIGVS